MKMQKKHEDETDGDGVDDEEGEEDINIIIMVLDSSLQLSSPYKKNNTWAYQSKREDVTLACEMAHDGGN